MSFEESRQAESPVSHHLTHFRNFSRKPMQRLRSRRVSPRGRQHHEQKILDEHERDVRVLELTGTLTFANADLIARRIEMKAPPQVLIVDFSHVPLMSSGAAKILKDLFRTLG